jgi:hypothetical protein
VKLDSTLTPKELRLVRADLKARGLKLPKSGWTIQLSNGTRVCRDQHGYYLTGPFPGVTSPLAKGHVYITERQHT